MWVIENPKIRRENSAIMSLKYKIEIKYIFGAHGPCSPGFIEPLNILYRPLNDQTNERGDTVINADRNSSVNIGLTWRPDNNVTLHRITGSSSSNSSSMWHKAICLTDNAQADWPWKGVAVWLIGGLPLLILCRFTSHIAALIVLASPDCSLSHLRLLSVVNSLQNTCK